MPYPRVPPRLTGSLVTDGALLHWEESGAPDGMPALWLHGGPGGSIARGGFRQRFDPERYRLIALDQRGSGRSVPGVLDDRERLAEHTTQRLIRDLEALRVDRGVERWVVAGVSWGTTLALAYALEHPRRVVALALLAVTTTSREEVDWITDGVGRIFPAEHAAFARDAHRLPGERIVEAYARRLAGGDAEDRRAAARAWDRWEGVHVSLDHPEVRDEGHAGPGGTDAEREAFATLVTHYWANDAFLPAGRSILARADELAGIPGALIHGRRDVSGPAITAWRLAERWSHAELAIVEGEGHGGERELDLLTAALDRFAR